MHVSVSNSSHCFTLDMSEFTEVSPKTNILSNLFVLLSAGNIVNELAALNFVLEISSVLQECLSPLEEKNSGSFLIDVPINNFS